MDITADLVSRAMRDLDEKLENWRNRPIDVVKILFADVTYYKVRVNGVVVSTGTFIVTGVSEDGHRAILAIDDDLVENEVHWRRAPSRLNGRGMRDVRLVVGDSHDGLRQVREATLPGVPWQRCQMHLQQNAQAFVTKTALKTEVAQAIRSAFNARTLNEAKQILADIVEKYAGTQSRLSAWMEDNIPEGLTVFAFPATVRPFLRTNNREENLNRQIRQRTRPTEKLSVQVACETAFWCIMSCQR